MRAKYSLLAAAVIAIAMTTLLLWPRDPAKPVFTAHTAQHKVNLTVDNLEKGPNTFDVEVTDGAGKPLAANTITVELAMPQMGHALPPVTAARTGPGHYRAQDTDIPMSGQWEVTVSLPGTEKAVFSLLVN